VVAASFNRPARAAIRLYLITDRRVVKSGGLLAACEAALEAARGAAAAGTVALQLREKDLPARELYELALRLRELCARAGAPLLINDRVDVALAAGADGVHLPFNSIGALAARRLLGPDAIIGASAHSLPDVVAAAREGADFAVFGPVFDPISKDAYGKPRGSLALAQVCREAKIPVLALGGITPERARELMSVADPNSRPAGVAAIGAIFASDSPADAVRAMIAALDVSRRSAS
jgi:thiamine-phosphate pyrophosphorylase